MAWEDVLRAREVREAAWRRENCRFNIIMGTAVGGLLLVGVVIGCAIVKGEPKVRAAYMARCEATGLIPNSVRCWTRTGDGLMVTRLLPSPLVRRGLRSRDRGDDASRVRSVCLAGWRSCERRRARPGRAVAARGGDIDAVP